MVPWNLLEDVPDIGDSVSPCLQFCDQCQASKWNHRHGGGFCQCLDVLHAESRASSFGETRG